MLLDALTLTGADDGVAPADLGRLADRHPQVEWAVLFSPAHEGQPRYPTQAWRRMFYAQAPLARRSAHLCGAALRALADGDTGLWDELLEHYQRVQLNVNARHLKPELLNALLLCSQELAAQGLTIITQHNTANASVTERFARVGRHAVLFDASGGRGARPDVWPAPMNGMACGYAGGLGPANILVELQRLDQQLPPNYRTWIDMESGVRTPANAFDLARVQAVVDSVDVWRAGQPSPPVPQAVCLGGGV